MRLRQLWPILSEKCRTPSLFVGGLRKVGSHTRNGKSGGARARNAFRPPHRARPDASDAGAGSSNMHPRPAFDSGTTLNNHTEYSLLTHCRVLQIPFAKSALIEPLGARCENPYSTVLFRLDLARGDRGRGGPVLRRSSMPTTLRDRGISCTSCAPSFWNASLGGLALQILRKRIFAPGVPEEMSRER